MWGESGGSDPQLSYGGGSLAVGPTGEVVGGLGEAEGVLSVEIDLAALRRGGRSSRLGRITA